MKNFFCTTAAALLMFLISADADAGTVYTVHELCKIASQSAQEIIIAEDDLYIAEQEKKRAVSVLIPTATLFGSKLVYEHPHMDEQNPDTETAGIKINQSFTLNGKELVALKISDDEITMKTYALERTRSDYLYKVIQAYYDILSAHEHIEIARSNVDRLEKHKKAVQERLNVGNVTRTALFRAEAELSRSKTDYVKAKNGLALAKASLKNLVKIEETFSVDKHNRFALDWFVPVLDRVKTTALQNRPEIKEAEKALEAAEKYIRYEKGSFWPTLSLEGMYSDSRFEYSEPEAATYETTNKSVMGELTFTLFDGGLRRAEVRQALAEKRKARNSLITIKKAIVLEAEKAWLDYKTAKSILNMLRDELKSATENYKAVKMQFRYGMADSVDMMDANTLLVTSEKEVSDAVYDLITTKINIIRTKGELLSFLDIEK